MDQAAVNRFFFIYILHVVGCLSLALPARAQQPPPLERVVTISFYQDRLDVALTKLSQQGKFVFSYNPAILDGLSPVTASFVNKTVREILNQLLKGQVQFKVKGNYIILTRVPGASQKLKEEEPLVIAGYVINGKSGEKLSAVSVYDRKTLSAAVTDEYGYFNLKIEKPADENLIAVNKKKFRDTVVMATLDGERFFTIALMPEAEMHIIPEGNPALSDSMIHVSAVIPVKEERDKERKPLSESEINMVNIRDTLYRKFQASFIPFAGTNHKLSGNVINDYSLNLFGGYSMGVRRLEIGGLFNVERGHVGKVQIAGMVNAVGGDVNGVQISGNINMTNGHVKAVQIGGLMNFNLNEVEGVQLAGLTNFNANKSTGFQVAGLVNLQVKDYKGSQLAGLVNVATHKITGSQISGLLNFGGNVKGSQIGFINVSDTIKGIPVGFMSLVIKGYHKIEISADEIFYTNLAFRTGVHQFYNIFSAGMKPDNFSPAFWTFGYGVGSAPKLARWLYLNFDVTSNHVNRGHSIEALSLLNKFYMGVDVQVARKFSVTCGATLNAYITERDYTDYPSLFTDYTPHFVTNRDIGTKSHLQMWWGAKVGVRFL